MRDRIESCDLRKDAEITGCDRNLKKKKKRLVLDSLLFQDLGVDENDLGHDIARGLA